MVVAGKVFKLSEPLPLSDIVERLQDYHSEEEYEEGDYKFTLVTEVVGLVSKENLLQGIYSHDFVMHVFHRGKVTPLPRTVEATFSFTPPTFLNSISLSLLATKLAVRFFSTTVQ